MGSQNIAIDEKELFSEYYLKLLHTIQINSLLPDLFSRKVITFEQKESCRYNGGSNPVNQITELLDHVIYRSLGTGCSLFDELLFAMKDSQDCLSQELAKEIFEKKNPSQELAKKIFERKNPRSRSKLTANYLYLHAYYIIFFSISSTR